MDLKSGWFLLGLTPSSAFLFSPLLKGCKLPSASTLSLHFIGTPSHPSHHQCFVLHSQAVCVPTCKRGSQNKVPAATPRCCLELPSCQEKTSSPFSHSSHSSP